MLYGIHLWDDLDRDRRVDGSRPNQNDYVFVILVTHPKSYIETTDRRDFGRRLSKWSSEILSRHPYSRISTVYIGLKSVNALNTNFFLLHTKSYHCSTYLSAQSDHCSGCPSCYSLLICCHPLSTTHIFSKIINRSFCYASPHLWNQLPVSFRQPCTKHFADVTLSNSSPTCSPLSRSITHSLFHSRLKTHLFHKSLLAPTWTVFSDYNWAGLTCSTVFHF